MTDEWLLDGALDPSLRFTGLRESLAEPRAVLLTGATGMLGAFMLAELLRTSAAEVHCLVRDDGGAPGARLRAHLEALGLWDPGFAGRIVAVVGDLGLPGLGLGQDGFAALAAQVEVIYHCGVMAHFLRPYAALRAVNVLGTAELLRLAATGATRAVHHVSTLAVFFDRAGFDGAATVSELDEAAPEGLRSGYVRSKWAAEQRVREAMRRGLPAAIYRTSRITGHSQTGATSSWNDLLASMIKACVLLGVYPALTIEVSMMPVDHVARAIVHLSRDERSPGRAFHLFQPAPIAWPALIGMIEAAGYPMLAVGYDDWRARLKRAATGDHLEREALARLWLLLGPDSALLGGRPRHDTPNSRVCLAGSGIECPPIDQALVSNYLGFFRQRGYIPGPGANHGPTR
jgi:thioester reductase-like protein